MTQCLGLSLLTSIVATLGRAGPSSAVDGREGGGGGTLGSRSKDEVLMKELQGCQVQHKFDLKRLLFGFGWIENVYDDDDVSVLG